MAMSVSGFDVGYGNNEKKSWNLLISNQRRPGVNPSRRRIVGEEIKGSRRERWISMKV